MATIQEQLRAIVADQQPGICLHEVADEAADVIDALVAVAERAYQIAGDQFREEILAALSRARGDIPTES